MRTAAEGMLRQGSTKRERHANWKGQKHTRLLVTQLHNGEDRHPRGFLDQAACRLDGPPNLRRTHGPHRHTAT